MKTDPQSFPSSNRKLDVQFLVMPYLDINVPAIGVSLIKEEIIKRGLNSRIDYFNIQFAQLVGLPLYSHLSGSHFLSPLAGEWLFACLAFDDRLKNKKLIVDHILSDWSRRATRLMNRTDKQIKQERKYLVENLIPEVLSLRTKCEDFIDECVEKVLAARPAVVGFTNISRQTPACLAVSRRLKSFARCPIIFFGGPNCHGVMGLQMIRSFPWIDYVCTGEGDQVVPSFIEQLLEQENPKPPSGILSRFTAEELSLPETVMDMDAVGIPDYSDYFIQRGQSRIHSEMDSPSFIVETSRGCWWGQRSQCKFCGLNGLNIVFRSKSPNRVVFEFKHLSVRYGVKKIQLADNLLSTRQFDLLFPLVARDCPGLELHCEIRADLSRKQLALLQAGGVQHVQPGIESLSNPILSLMEKGTNSLQNIQLLRSCEELRLLTSWFFLYGFPGEPTAEYDRMARLVPLLVHLSPPLECRRITVQRFSPYFTHTKQHGICLLRPCYPYSLVFPLKQDEIENLSSCFEFDYTDGRNPTEYTRNLRESVSRWQALWDVPPAKRPRLDAFPVGKTVVLTDTRPCATQSPHRLIDITAQVFLLCDEARDMPTLVRMLSDQASHTMVSQALSSLMENMLLVENNGKYLSLAILRRQPK